MKRATRSAQYARIKYILGFAYIAFGLVILVQFVHGVGFRAEGLSGYVLGLALIALGIIRVRGGWPRGGRQ